MSKRYRFYNKDGVYFVTITVKHWIDVFTRREYKDILVENLEFCQKNKGLEIFAWVIMTNHLHLVVRAKDGFLLEDIMRDYKKFTSKALIKAIIDNPQESRKEWLLKGFRISKTTDASEVKESYRFWQDGNHPIELCTNEVIDEKINYIHKNPIKAGFVCREQDFLYSSAVCYAGEKGLLNIDI
jgi:REP element-mobilizing transposase RayT